MMTCVGPTKCSRHPDHTGCQMEALRSLFPQEACDADFFGSLYSLYIRLTGIVVAV